jgi:hypothetical protein
MLNCGKREENMKIKTYYFIFAVATGFFCAVVLGQAEQFQSGEKPSPISRPHPAYVGIDTLNVVVLQYGTKEGKDETFFKQLETETKEKLQQAGIKFDTPTADNILTTPELRIYVNILRLEDSQQHVFHIRAALARAVRLKDERNPVFKSDIWQATPVMQTVSAEITSAKVTDAVLEQVDDFIEIYEATKSSGKQLSDESVNETDSSIAPEKKIDAAEYKYVASNSSNIFHKPQCRWTQNISKRNLITYKSKDEAIKAGKRPCKTCNP